MIALIDSDILIYRVGCVTNDESEAYATRRLQSLLDNMLTLDLQDVFQWEVYLTGKNNFRHDVAVTVPYKGNRKAEKPTHYHALRDYLVEKWDAEVIDGMEADDMLAIRQEVLGDKSIIVTLDKDLDQVVGWKYNFVKKDRYYITEEAGLLKFYCQFLEGDRVDNIIGAKGIGKVKAKKLLEGHTEPVMWSLVVEELGMDRAIENGHLLYMLRTVDDSFIKHLDRQGIKHGNTPLGRDCS